MSTEQDTCAEDVQRSKYGKYGPTISKAARLIGEENVKDPQSTTGYITREKTCST